MFFFSSSNLTVESQDFGHVVRRVKISMCDLFLTIETHYEFYIRDQTGSEARTRMKLFCSMW